MRKMFHIVGIKSASRNGRSTYTYPARNGGLVRVVRNRIFVDGYSYAVKPCFKFFTC